MCESFHSVFKDNLYNQIPHIISVESYRYNIQTNVYVTLNSINKYKTPRKNMSDKCKRNEKLISKYQDEINRYE